MWDKVLSYSLYFGFALAEGKTEIQKERKSTALPKAEYPTA
jgi:hypothetical protein